MSNTSMCGSMFLPQRTILENSCVVVMDVPNTDNLYFENVESAPHTDLIILIARGVGILVAIAAVIFLILILIFVRATLSLLILKWGISITCSVFTISTIFLIKHWKIPLKNISTMLLNSCH